MKELIPTILVESEKDFEHRLRLVENHSSVIQVDVLDGTLFPEMSWADPRSVGAMRTDVSFELHLMVENPMLVAEQWKARVPNFKRAIFHAELDRQHQSIIGGMKALGLEVGMALNPETPINEAHHEIGMLDELILMLVHPGSSGQGAGDPKHGLKLDDLLKKISDIHAKYPNLKLGADGGINKNNIRDLAQAGITRFYVGSAIFTAADPSAALCELKDILSEQTS